MVTFDFLAKFLATPLTTGLAYLDPGSGSFILQLLLAALLGGAFILKTYWQKITTFFRTRLGRRQDDGNE